jgi:hypothetical protein
MPTINMGWVILCSTTSVEAAAKVGMSHRKANVLNISMMIIKSNNNNKIEIHDSAAIRICTNVASQFCGAKAL